MIANPPRDHDPADRGFIEHGLRELLANAPARSEYRPEPTEFGGSTHVREWRRLIQSVASAPQL